MNITYYAEGSPWQLNGQFWQAPCVLINQGVHAGSHGPIFWADHVLKEAVKSWANIPVTLGHPMVGDSHVSVNHSPEVFVKYAMGEVINPYFDEAKKAIRGTLQIPVGLPKALMDRVKNLREVSVGIFSEDTQTYGQFNGKSYHACAISMKPDHLAILPEGQKGACNFESDGCGIRVNAAGHKILQNALTTYVNNLMNGGNIMNDEYNMATPQLQAVEGETEVDVVQVLKEFEDFPGLVPLWVTALRARQEIKQSQDTYQDGDMLLPFGVQ